MLIKIPPTIAIGKVIRIKQNTSGEMKQKFWFLRKVYWRVDGERSEGYFVSVVGVDEGVIQAFVKHLVENDDGQMKLAMD